MGVLGRSLPCWWGNVYYMSASIPVSSCFSFLLKSYYRTAVKEDKRWELVYSQREILQMPHTTTDLGETCPP